MDNHRTFLLCIGASVIMNLRELKYASRERWAGSLEILEANRYLQSKKIKVHHPNKMHSSQSFMAKRFLASLCTNLYTRACFINQ